MTKVIGIILARGGSKSIPKKSIYPLAGKPLLYYVIKAAAESKLISRLIISTDDKEIAAVARKYGVEVPFMRPKKIATDHTPDLPVFKHALNWLKKNENYTPEIIVHLRPTAPLMCGKDIDRAIKILMKNPRADSIRSISLPEQTPFKMFTIDLKTGYLKPLLPKEFPKIFKKHHEPYNMPRQILPPVWKYAGYIDVIRYNTVMKYGSMSGQKQIPLTFEEWRNIDIDSMRELKFAEMIIKSRKIK